MSKLVINSCVSYSAWLTRLLTSLKKFSVNFDDVIIVKGCSVSNVEPRREMLEDACMVTVVECEGNHYDFNAVCALCKYVNHPLIVANAYLFIHDTCEGTSTLPSVMEKLKFCDTNAVHVPPSPSANIFAIGRQVLVRMSTVSAFRTVVTKRQAMDVEHGRSRDTHSVHSYGRIVLMRPRRRCGIDDTRITFFYPDFGIFKFVTLQPFHPFRTQTPSL